MSVMLARYHDPRLQVAPGESLEGIAQVESARIVRNLALVQAAVAIPRRLGPDVDGKALSRDKKICRRLAYVEGRLLERWGIFEETKVDEQATRREAAVVNWELWAADQNAHLRGRLAYVASYCVKLAPERELDCKRALRRLEDEIRWIATSLR